MTTDRNLPFGTLVFQNEYIDLAQFAWESGPQASRPGCVAQLVPPLRQLKDATEHAKLLTCAHSALLFKDRAASWLDDGFRFQAEQNARQK